MESSQNPSFTFCQIPNTRVPREQLISSEIEESIIKSDIQNDRFNEDVTITELSSDSNVNTKSQSPDIITFDNKQKNVNKASPGELQLQSIMVSSMTSSLAETPGDSGVLCLDSETSELTSEYLPGMSLSLVGAEELTCDNAVDDSKPSDRGDKFKINLHRVIDVDDVIVQSDDDDNQNITPQNADVNISDVVRVKESPNLPDIVATSQEKNDSTNPVLQKTFSIDLPENNLPESSGAKPKMSEAMKSVSDDIVYRRKCNKKSNQSQPKKRVSFHEDILNNTKTDNIHIEHGFVMYRPEGTLSQLSNAFKKQNTSPCRNSWCTVGDNSYYDNQMYALGRNTRSDVLVYGRTEVTGLLDKSGVYEYEDESYLTKTNKCEAENCVNKSNQYNNNKVMKEDTKNENDSPSENRQLYICSCNSSDSNLSSESETSSSQTLSCTSDSNVKYNTENSKCENAQKSFSCDCIGNGLQRPMMRTMYFSDADITHHADFNETEEQLQMSEILPRASCLKKSSLKKKRYISTDIIEEHESKTRKGMRNLLDTKAIFGSLKNIYKTMNFGLAITERGVPEGSEDCQSVLEVLPLDNPPKPDNSYLSKSFDCKFEFPSSYNNCKEIRIRGDGYSKHYTHKVDDILRRKDSNFEVENSHIEETTDKNIDSTSGCSKSDVSKQSLTLDMKANTTKVYMDWKTQKNITLKTLNQPENLGSENSRNKFIVNGESTVYEHRGVSYCYEYDTFKTTFDTTKDTFTPINDTNPSLGTVVTQKTIKDNEENIKVEVPTINELNDDNEDSKTISETIDSENVSSSSNDKAKIKSNKLMDANDKRCGVAKHLSSPLKQKNVMRYDKNTKQNDTPRLANENTFETNSVQDTINESDFDETLEILEGYEYNLKSLNRKSSLMNRFLKNVGQRKALDAKLQQNEFFQNKLKEESVKFPNICYPKNAKICPNYKKSAKYIDYLINKEVAENKRISVKLMTADEPSYFDSFEENVAIECNEKLRLELFMDSSEILQRMLKVRSAYCKETGDWTPQLVFITDRALYVADLNSSNSSYNVLCCLPHNQLDTIVIGPDSQYTKIYDVYGVCRCILITGDRYLCHRLVSSLEWSSRNCRVVEDANILMGNVPSIIWKYREHVKNSLTTLTSVSKFENCIYYGMVASSLPSSCYTGRPASPFPPLEGFLMFKTDKQKYWRPSYFLLKSGVLSYGSSTPPSEPFSASSLPHSILLEGVLGVRRCTDAQGRPHCFEIALKANKSLQMAAPDDDTASQWLQALLMHAAQALEGPKIDKSKKTLPPCCTLIATSEHIVTFREQLTPAKSLYDSDITITNADTDENHQESTSTPVNKYEILSCAHIKDLTAFKIPDNDDNWCILEFHFCEVREGTEMGLLFDSSAELEIFIGTVESLWHTTNEGVFPISVIPKSEAVSGRFGECHHCFTSAWNKLLPTAQC